MALGGKALDLMFDLYERDFFKDIKSVIDMGDQDIFAAYSEIDSFGINEAFRMDIVKLERDKNDTNKHVIQDLNFPLKDKNLNQKFDLVTDFGNNEHPFNIVEAYKLCTIYVKKMDI